MHELSLAQSVIGIVADRLRDEPDARVRVMRLEIGALSHVDPGALRTCISAASRGTIAQGARVEIAVVPGQALCRSCGANVRIGGFCEACPDCGSARLRIETGEEMRVREIEVA